MRKRIRVTDLTETSIEPDANGWCVRVEYLGPPLARRASHYLAEVEYTRTALGAKWVAYTLRRRYSRYVKRLPPEEARWKNN